MIQEQEQNAQNCEMNLVALESKKNTLHKFKYNEIGIFQGLVQNAEPSEVRAAVHLSTDKQWHEIGRRPLAKRAKGLSRLNFHLNPKIPGYAPMGVRAPLPGRQKDKRTGQNESVMAYKRRLMKVVGYVPQNPQLFQDPSFDEPALDDPSRNVDAEDTALARVPTATSTGTTAGNKRKAAHHSDQTVMAMLEPTADGNSGTISIGEAQGILLGLERQQLEAIEKALGLDYIPRKLIEILGVVPKFHALVNCLKTLDDETLEDLLGGAKDLAGPVTKKQKRGTPKKVPTAAALPPTDDTYERPASENNGVSAASKGSDEPLDDSKAADGEEKDTEDRDTPVKDNTKANTNNTNDAPEP